MRLMVTTTKRERLLSMGKAQDEQLGLQGLYS